MEHVKIDIILKLNLEYSFENSGSMLNKRR